MRLQAVLLAVGFAAASASPAWADPKTKLETTCDQKGWLASLICKAKKDAEARPRSLWSWLRERAEHTQPATPASAAEQSASAPRSGGERPRT